MAELATIAAVYAFSAFMLAFIVCAYREATSQDIKMASIVLLAVFWPAFPAYVIYRWLARRVYKPSGGY